MSVGLKKAYMCPIIIGVLLLAIGLTIPVPGGVLTTYKFMDGERTTSYVFDDKYSSIDEYVGGDAYNYIIGASLIGGKMAGMISAKAVAMVGGAICICFGVTLMMLEQGKNPVESLATEDVKWMEISEESRTEGTDSATANMEEPKAKDGAV